MRIVADRVQTLRLALREVVLVGRDGADVRLRRVGVPADPKIDVRGHVDHVARGRHQAAEPIGDCFGDLWRAGALHEVDVVVIRPWMIRMGGHHPLERCANRGRGRLEGTVRLPVVPGHRVHGRVGVQRLHVGIVGERRRDRRHCVRVCAIERGSRGCRIGSEARGQRLDEGAVAAAGRRRQRSRPLNGLEGLASAGLGHRRVQIRRQRHGLSPVGHRQGRIEPGRLLKCASRLGVIERVEEAHPLIEERLRSGNARRHRDVKRAEVAQLGSERRGHLCLGQHGSQDDCTRKTDGSLLNGRDYIVTSLKERCAPGVRLQPTCA